MATTDALQRKRLRLLFRLFVGMLSILVIFRLGYWMIIKAEWLREKASVQWIRQLPVEPQRGNIEDRHGSIFAASVTSNTVVLHPKAISPEELPELVERLAKILNIDKETIEKKALKTNYSVVWLDRQISQEQSQLIREFDSSGVSLAEDKKRYYPLDNYLTQVLGFTSVDGEGLEGIESRFDYILRGTPGSIVTETDRDGDPLPGSYEEYLAPIEGNNIKLTIDLAIQSYTEKAMDICMQETDAKSAVALVMDCNTGEILAIVNKPDFDINEPPRHDIDLLRKLTTNLAISNEYEPGSIFKLISMAAAIDSGAISTGYEYSCPGYIDVNGKRIVCWTQKPHGHQNLYEVLENSCNTAIIDMTLQMGTNKFYEYIDDFGFGKSSKIELYGESSGNVISPKYIRDEDLANISIGQYISVTPLQLISAVSSIVNGGYLMQPRIIKEIITPENEIIESYSSEILKTVISYETSGIMSELMQAVVDNGNGVNAKIDGYNIGGMSATAQKYRENGSIMQDKHVASFVAAAPINNPQIVVLVVVDEPNIEAHYGSLVAAPYVKMILEEALPYLSIMPDNNYVTNGNTVIVPDVVGMSVDDAKNTLYSSGIDYIVEGYEGIVVAQMPQSGVNFDINNKAIIYLEQEDDQNIDKKVEIPNIIDMKIVEANNILTLEGLRIKINGVGSVVISQNPKPDTDGYENDIVIATLGYPEIEEE